MFENELEKRSFINYVEEHLEQYEERISRNLEDYSYLSIFSPEKELVIRRIKMFLK
ncbi:hypothetical protein [Gottschalkia acidurici]|uniref:hypothetical protein n=1 Tax=Clostridium acidurici TaxID=1556 RepID=UPI0002D300D3|nr:hypothetical protein [Gottschalkia acidurici]